MELGISFAEGGSSDDLRALRGWLLDEDDLRGRVNLVTRPGDAGTLGPVLDALQVALGPGGAAIGVCASIISWLRHRRSDVTVKVAGADRTVEVSARDVRGLDAETVRNLVDSLARELDNREIPDRADE